MVPAKLADRHQVVPFEVVDRTLRVAIVNPKNLLALDEIAFVSGHKVEAWVAPEILVHRALEKHYGVPRKLRHITVSGQLTADSPPPRRSRPVSPQPTEKPDPTAEHPVAVPPRPTPPAGRPQDSDPVTASVAASVEPARIREEDRPSPLAPVEAAIESVLSAPAPPASGPAVDDAVPGSPPLRAEARDPGPESDLAAWRRRSGTPHPIETAPYAFVEQERPKVHLDAERHDPSDKRRSVDWIKYENDGRQAWCELYHLPLEDPHFRHLGGVYVIWHTGHHPVVRVGQGYIKTELTTLRLDARLESRNRESRLFVTWARVPREDRDGVGRFLYDMLDPELRDQPPDAEPLVVNLPC